MVARVRTTIDFRAGPVSEGDARVQLVRGVESLSTPFRFDVDLDARDDALDPRDLLGVPARIAFRRTDSAERFVNGVVLRAELHEVRAGRAAYRAHVVPRLSLLGLRSRSRVFQNLTAVEIVKTVLDEARVEHRPALDGTYPTREYCVQYRETDLAFVSRLLEEEGIVYWFEQGEEGHTLVLADSPGALEDVPGDATIPFRTRAIAHDEASDEHVFALARTSRLRPDKFALRDFDFVRPALDLTATAATSRPAPLECFEYRLGPADPGALRCLSRTRLEELRSNAVVLRGEGTCLRFAPGLAFEVAEHPDPSFNHRLQLLSVEHEARQEGAAGAAIAITHEYRCRFEAALAEQPVRPQRRTRRPVIAGAQTAVVVGPGSEEIHPDSHERVKVQFHWDREGKRDDRSSCFVRVAQAWAGAGYGASHVPRIGQEVVVRFLDGDPDRPIVTGAVYNGRHVPPVGLPGEKTQSTLRSDSSPGSGGSNELRFEDVAGAEQVLLHAQRDENAVVEAEAREDVWNAEVRTIQKDRSATVGGDQGLRVGRSETDRIVGGHAITVAATRTTATTGDHAERVAGPQTITVGALRDVEVLLAAAESVGAARALNVGGAYAVTVGGVENTLVAGARLEQVGAARVEAVGGRRQAIVAKDASSRVGGESATTVQGATTLTTSKDQDETVGGAARVEAADTVVLEAREFQWEATKLTVNVGGNVVLTAKSSGDVSFGAKAITLDGTTMTLKGSKVAKSAGGGPASAAGGKAAAEKDEVPTAKARWSKAKVVPVHNSAWPPASPPTDAVPAECDASPIVETTNVPDGTKAVITIRHCVSGATVKGGRLEGEVRGGKIVDPSTGQAHVFHFGAEQLPWDPFDKPFFHFKAAIQHRGLTAETPADAKDGGKSLKVEYWHVCVSDAIADTPAGGKLTTGDEMNEIAGILRRQPDHEVGTQAVNQAIVPLKLWGSLLRNGYAYHHASHGDIVDRTTGRQLNGGSQNPPEVAVANWRSVVVLGDTNLGDKEVRDKKAVPSAPRYLAYLNTCVAGWEPSLARAFLSRGTRYVIAFRMYIPDGPARAMARKFHLKWSGTHKCNPDKIRDLFWQLRPTYDNDMKPVLFGRPGEEIAAAVRAVSRAVKAFVATVASLLK